MPDQKSGLDRAKSMYTLVEPIPASESLWNAYTAERRAVQMQFSTVLLTEPESDDEDGYDETGDGAIAKEIAGAVRGLEEELGLPEDSLLSGVSILHEGSLFEEEDKPRTVTLLTRIYSVSSPSSVDLHLTYHCRSRFDSVEWYIGIGYKINSRPSPNKLPECTNTLRQIGLRNNSNFSTNMYSGHGWNTFYKAFFDDEQGFSGRQWKRYEVKEMGLYEDGLRDVHDALLGSHPCMDDENPPSSETDTSKRKRLVQTARLLLACVGITCSIATQDSDLDIMPGWSTGGIHWCLEGISTWFAREVRKAVGFQLERDAREEKAYAEAVEEEIRGYDEDEDEDEDESESESESDDSY